MSVAEGVLQKLKQDYTWLKWARAARTLSYDGRLLSVKDMAYK